MQEEKEIYKSRFIIAKYTSYLPGISGYPILGLLETNSKLKKIVEDVLCNPNSLLSLLGWRRSVIKLPPALISSRYIVTVCECVVLLSTTASPPYRFASTANVLPKQLESELFLCKILLEVASVSC